ncbi:MAG: AraC family transcriptional regulator [Imperialibacter sp.]
MSQRLIYDRFMHELSRESTQLNRETIAPCPSLQHLISNYFVLQQESQCPTSAQWYILPDNCAHLIFYLFENGKTVSAKWAMVGPRSRHKMISRQNRLFTFICSFRPGGMAPFGRLPLSELTDSSSEASYILKAYDESAYEALTRYALQHDLSGFVGRLETFLLRAPESATIIHPVVSAFCNSYRDHLNRPQLDVVAKKLGYSDRHLRSLLRMHVGHSPKMITQIDRFTCSLLQSDRQQNWASIAHASGYYDQSHMISDYHKLVGTSPEKLFS